MINNSLKKKILSSYVLVQFNNGITSSTNVDNPNNLEPDQEDKTFYCFASVQVIIC